MKKSILLILLLCILVITESLAQKSLKPIWIILTEKPETELVRSHDNAKFGLYETVLPFDKTDRGVLSLDPIGRTINIKSNYAPATYAPHGFSGPCLTLESTKLKDGTTIGDNLFVWCYQVDSAEKTAKLQVGTNKFVTIPLNRITLIRDLPKKEEDEDEPVLRTVSQMPMFNGNVGEYLSGEIRYPRSAVLKGIQGKVITEFVVDKEGWISRPIVVKSSGNEELDNEALHVIRTMPQWKPGIVDGKPVKVYFRLPITFKLD